MLIGAPFWHGSGRGLERAHDSAGHGMGILGQMMSGRRVRSRRGWIFAVVTLYGVLLMAAPVLHHDFACHQKSPTHCGSCTASPSAPHASAHTVLAPPLTLLGQVAVDGPAAVSVRPVPTRLGRAPPA